MSSVNLSSKNITDSQNIFTSFIEPSKIVSLNLSNNKITKLPENLSFLTNLKYLSLLNNPLENYELIGRSLSTLPKLSELKLDLTTQEHAYLILSQLPNLLFLNGKSTSDDELDEKNQIDLNDTETDKSSLKSEIPNFNSVTNKITQILTQRNEKTDEFYTEFQSILQKQINLINNLDNQIPNYVYVTYIKQAKIEIYTYLQNKILNMINTKVDYLLINLLNEVNQYIKKIFGGTVNIIQSIFNKFEDTEKNYKNEINQRDAKIEDLLKQIQILNEKLNNNDKNNEENKDRDKEKLTNEKNKLKMNNENINIDNKENEYIENRTDYNHDRSINDKNQNDYNIINNNDNSNFSISYNDEAKNIIDNLKPVNSNRNSKDDFKKINNIQNMTFNNNKNMNIIQSVKNTLNKNENINININQNKEKKTISELSYIKGNNQNNNFLNEPSLSYQPSLSNLSQYTNITNINPRDLKIVVGPLSKRDYSLRQLLETINDIYNSKLENDKKLVQNHQQKLTMEQFLYYYLNNKYGLKNLVIEYASGIIQGIKDFSKKNSEVLLFGKILRNELEEQEILIISKLKETITDFLIYYYQNKYQYKSKNEVDILVQKCKSGILVEDQWKNIVGYLFSDNENDLMNLINRIQKYIDKQNSTIESNKKYGNSISYNKFIQLVIDYQIKLRSLYLKNFNHIFKILDTDHNGIIYDYEFVKLVEMANVYSTREEIEIKTQMMLKELDKYGNKNIIYNDIIELWSKEMTIDQITGEKLTLLDKLSME